MTHEPDSPGGRDASFAHCHHTRRKRTSSFNVVLYVIALMGAIAAMLAIPAALRSGHAAESVEPTAPPASVPFKHPRNLWELTVAGGVVMIPIGLCSIVAMAVALERLISLRRKRIIPPNFMKGLVAAFGPDGTDAQGALTYCDRNASPLANIIRVGVLKLGRRLEIVEKAVEDAAASEMARMRRGLEALAIVGTISPLLGLLGTIYGMISAFRNAAQHGLGRGELLASGIYVALVTTAAGLTVAIPTLLVYYYFVGRIENFADEIESISNDFLDQCHEEPPPGAMPPSDHSTDEEKRGRWIDPGADARMQGLP
jgi:biopolymer transport protein ExbB